MTFLRPLKIPCRNSCISRTLVLSSFHGRHFSSKRLYPAAALFFIGGYLYHSLLEGLFGQTLGKKLCGIRVLKADFTPCGLSAGFLRNLLRIVDAFFYYLVAAISLAGTFKWQRLGDLVAETVVVRDTKRGL